MEDGGWIERLSNPQDRRERQVRMTAKAEKALESARHVGDEVAIEALSGFSQREREQLTDLLQRVRTNLSRTADADSATAKSRSETKDVHSKLG